jgi:hypothetical protein
MLGNILVSERLAASQKRLSSKQLVSYYKKNELAENLPFNIFLTTDPKILPGRLAGLTRQPKLSEWPSREEHLQTILFNGNKVSVARIFTS